MGPVYELAEPMSRCLLHGGGASLEQPPIRMKTNYGERACCCLGQRHVGREVLVGSEDEQVNRQPRIPRVLRDKTRQGRPPALLWGTQARPTPVPLESRDYRRSRHSEATIAFPEMLLIGPLVCQTLTNEIAGAAPRQYPGHRIGIAMERLERVLIGKGGEVGGEAARQHRPHLAQGERARDIEEVAQREG